MKELKISDSNYIGTRYFLTYEQCDPPDNVAGNEWGIGITEIGRFVRHDYEA